MMSNDDLLREARRELSYAEMLTFNRYLIDILAYKVRKEEWAESVESAKNLIDQDRRKK